MTDQLKKIVQEFEEDLLTGVRSGADEADLLRLRDNADDKLREIKAGASADELEAIFAAAIEINTKLEMAIRK